jgi:glutamyl/glutaminyl-tRNA synthetase
MLGRQRPVQLLHHALLVHPDGSKLSKASHDTALRDLRAAGATPAQLFGLAAQRAALVPDARPLPVDALPELFA